MNGVESVGSGSFGYSVPKVTKTAETQVNTDQPWRRIGMEDALKLSGRYLSEALNEAGFIDLHAGAVERIEVYLQHQAMKEEPTEPGGDEVVTAEVAAYLGSQIALDMNRALRIMAYVDPARVAALLR